MARQCIDRWLAGGPNVEAAPDTVHVGDSSYAVRDIEACRVSEGMCRSAVDVGDGLDELPACRALRLGLHCGVDDTRGQRLNPIVRRTAAADSLEIRTSNDAKLGPAHAKGAAVSVCSMTVPNGDGIRRLAVGQIHNIRYPAGPDAARAVRRT